MAETYLTGLVRQQRAAERAAAADRKARTDYVVVAYHEREGQPQPERGYVVRSRYDGYLPTPYRGAEVLRVYKSDRLAQKYADRLNGL